MDRPMADEPEESPVLEREEFVERRTRVTSAMVTGVGGTIGQGIIKALADTSYRVVGLDSNESAAGLYAVPRGYIVPETRDPAFVDRLIEIGASENASYLLLGLDMDLPVIARAAVRFRQAGILPIVSSPEVIDLCDDKLETARFLESLGLPAPRTADFLDDDIEEVGFPLVLKPRRGGSRSRNVVVVEDEARLHRVESMIDPLNCVAQEYIEGEEYSCGSITFDGACAGVAVMKRKLRDGDTYKAQVMRHPKIEAFVRRVAESLRPFGPCNFQLRYRRGVPYVFEINPRCSGGSYIRALAGFNEPRMTLDHLERGAAPSWRIRPISVFRYWKEIVVDTPKVTEARRAGAVRNSTRGL